MSLTEFTPVWHEVTPVCALDGRHLMSGEKYYKPVVALSGKESNTSVASYTNFWNAFG